MLSLRAIMVERERERERERVNSTASEWRITGALIVVLFAIIGICCYLGIQNSANAVPQSVNFNAVTIRNGAKINVNSNKSLTSVDGGNKLVADNTSSNTVKGDGISSAVNEFASSNYGTDALFSTNTAKEGKLLSEAECSAFKSYLSTVTSEYWLSDTGSRGSITWQSYAKGENWLVDNKLTATGIFDDKYYYKTQLANGSLAFNKSISGSSYYVKSGGFWSPDGNSSTELKCYKYGNSNPLANGSVVFNNPDLYSSGFDIEGNPYVKTLIVNSMYPSIVGFVNSNGLIERVQPGQTLSKSTTLACILPTYTGMVDPLRNNFYFHTVSSSGVSSFYGGLQFITGAYIVFTKSNSDVFIGGVNSVVTTNHISHYLENETVDVIPIEGSLKSIRPSYSLVRSNIVFMRTNESDANLSTTSSFGDLPTSVANFGEDRKVVVKSNDTTIRSNVLSSSNFSVSGSSIPATYTISRNIISVPAGATSLTFNSSSFATNNANYISALADTEYGTQKYAVLGRTSESVTLDLTSILNNARIGSRTTVSFYAEKANAASNSDLISATPVSFEISVVAGSSQTISYSKGEGTSGTAPSNATLRVGQSYSFANGTGLSKEGNPFSCWEVIFVKYGETQTTTWYVRSGESILVPNASSGQIRAKALYAGITATKSTDSKPTVMTITWDSNAPSGFTAEFKGSGSFNNNMSLRYDKAIVNGTVIAPEAPILNSTSGDTRVFDGWNTKKDGTGSKIEVGKSIPSVTKNITYYAKWVSKYIVTFDATGGDGSSLSGKYSDGSTLFTDEVIPNTKTYGPSSNPVPDNNSGLYMFYGWTTQPNGGGRFVDVKSGITINSKTITYYACYGSAYTFLAKADQDTPNPRNIKGAKYSINQVKTAADSIKNGTNPDSSVYSSNDTYHLYTLLKNPNGTYMDAEQQDSWAEFRIIQVGAHDSDGTGLTFEMIHGLPGSYKYQLIHDKNGIHNWAASDLRPLLQPGGNIYAQFDAELLGKIKPTYRKYNTKGAQKVTSSITASTFDYFTILSYTEILKSANTEYYNKDSLGSTYEFWTNKNLSEFNVNNPKNTTLQKRSLTRSGSKIDGAHTYYPSAYLRTLPAPEGYEFYVDGTYAEGVGHSSWLSAGASISTVVLCFSI